MKRLTEKERQLISLVELPRSNNIKYLAKLSGIKEYTVHYHLKKLEDEGIISSQRPIIDWNRLGYTHYTVYFSLKNELLSVKNKIIKYLVNSENISWVFEVGGQFNLGVSISTLNSERVMHDLEDFAKKFGGIISSKIIAVQMSLVYFGKRYLSPYRKLSSPIVFTLSRDVLKIDDVDLKILRASTQESYKNNLDLAKKIHIPHTTLDRRLKRLEREKVIIGYQRWLDTTKLNVQGYLFLIEITGFADYYREKLMHFASEQNNIVYISEMIGAWDFEVGVELDEHSKLNELLDGLYKALPNAIRSVNIVPLIKYYKFRNYSLKK